MSEDSSLHGGVDGMLGGDGQRGNEDWMGGRGHVLSGKPESGGKGPGKFMSKSEAAVITVSLPESLIFIDNSEEISHC